MTDAEIKFEREGLGGLVAVGSYLGDTVKRFGIRFEQECDHTLGQHYCEIVISSGIDHLSPLTQLETEHFAALGRRTNERLAHEAQIIKAGEIVIMTDEKKQAPKSSETAKDPLKTEFDALPLEKKIAALMRMEAVTLSETLAYVVNSPMKVVEKVGDVMAEFGMKLEQEARKATRPSTAAPATDPIDPSASQKSKNTSRKTSPGNAKP